MTARKCLKYSKWVFVASLYASALANLVLGNLVTGACLGGLASMAICMKP